MNQKNWCRVLPEFVANNFTYFELIQAPMREPKNYIGYAKKIKIQLLQLKNDLTE